MRTWAIWYRNLFFAWLVIGLPSLVVGYGFSGGRFMLPSNDALGLALWVLMGLFIVSPLLLWRWRKHGRVQGF